MYNTARAAQKGNQEEEVRNGGAAVFTAPPVASLTGGVVVPRGELIAAGVEEVEA
jgi:hypothetical protein